MGLLERTAERVVGGNAGHRLGSGRNPLVEVLTSLLSHQASYATAGRHGLDLLVDRFVHSGQGEVIASWIGNGHNRIIATGDLASSLGHEAVAALALRTGIAVSDMLSQLSRMLPGIVDKLTPRGRLPTPREQEHW